MRCLSVLTLLLSLCLAPLAEAGKPAVMTDRQKTARVRTLLKNTIIPEVNFRQAHVRDVIQFLSRSSINGDPLGKGINIVFNVKRTRKADVKKADDLFAPVEATKAPLDDQRVTFGARYISIGDALNAVMDVTGLKYVIRSSVVMVVHPTWTDRKLKHRSYTVDPNILKKLEALQRELGHTK